MNLFALSLRNCMGYLLPHFMPESPVSEYDKFAYPTAAYAQTHPDRLATVGTLFGLQPARVERARVLELGCGDGNNLITMACTLPDAEFHGIDLAAEPIRKGCQMLAVLGLRNVELRQMNIMEAPRDLGTFDYIIAHGLYSWVPEAVREQILAICRRHLADNGIAYVSFNAYPGCHLRDLTRRMMLFHAGQFSEPSERVKQARALLKFLAGAKSESGLWQEVLQHELERIEKYQDGGFFHDDLSPVYRPFYFYEFMEAARRHELEFVAEADVKDMQPAGLSAEAVRVIDKMEQMNRVAHEQYLDFVAGRAFRQTLLCRRECRLDRELKPERICRFLVAADGAPVNPAANAAAPGMEDFQRGKTVIATSQPLLKSALMFLGRVWPRRVPFDELLNKARELAAGAGTSNQPPIEAARGDLADFLLRCYAIGFVDLHSYPSTFVTEISERPIASPLARLQISQGTSVSSPRHLALKIDDALGRDLVRLLDGTRDRPALLEDLGRLVTSGSTPVYCDGKLVTDPKRALEVLGGQLEASLASVAKLGLLVG